VVGRRALNVLTYAKASAYEVYSPAVKAVTPFYVVLV
jgi:hypothetical protein